jgi:hypothetical protein
MTVSPALEMKSATPIFLVEAHSKEPKAAAQHRHRVFAGGKSTVVAIERED